MKTSLLVLVSLCVGLTGCAVGIPMVPGTGHYRVDVPTTNWQVGEVVAIYIGRNTPYSINSIYDPKLATVRTSDAPLQIEAKVLRDLGANLGATLNRRVRGQGAASGNSSRNFVMTLKNVRTIQAPHTEIIRALREGGLTPGSVECEYLGDLSNRGVLVDVLNGLLIADIEIEQVDRDGAKLEADATAQTLVEGSLGVKFERSSATTMVGRDLVIGYKKDAVLLETARRTCQR